MENTVSASPQWFSIVFSAFNLLLFLLVIGVSILVAILFIKLARRGIKALDIYIKKYENDIVD